MAMIGGDDAIDALGGLVLGGLEVAGGILGGRSPDCQRRGGALFQADYPASTRTIGPLGELRMPCREPFT